MKKNRQVDRELWWLPNDFFLLGHARPIVIADTCDYRFKGYVCPKCNVVYQFTPDMGDEPLPDFPTYGKDRKVCNNCA